MYWPDIQPQSCDTGPAPSGGQVLEALGNQWTVFLPQAPGALAQTSSYGCHGQQDEEPVKTELSGHYDGVGYGLLSVGSVHLLR